MGRNIIQTCEICLKSMRGDNLYRNLKKHEKEPEMEMDKNSAKCEICMKIIKKDHLKRHMMNHEKKNVEDEKGMFHEKLTFELQEFNRKKEMGRKIKEIIDNKANFNENALSKESKETLDIFNLYGKSSQMVKTNWRGWQQ